jgi:hypothetical protein
MCEPSAHGEAVTMATKVPLTHKHQQGSIESMLPTASGSGANVSRIFQEQTFTTHARAYTTLAQGHCCMLRATCCLCNQHHHSRNRLHCRRCLATRACSEHSSKGRPQRLQRTRETAEYCTVQGNTHLLPPVPPLVHLGSFTASPARLWHV